MDQLFYLRFVWFVSSLLILLQSKSKCGLFLHLQSAPRQKNVFLSHILLPWRQSFCHAAAPQWINCRGNTGLNGIPPLCTTVKQWVSFTMKGVSPGWEFLSTFTAAMAAPHLSCGVWLTFPGLSFKCTQTKEGAPTSWHCGILVWYGNGVAWSWLMCAKVKVQLFLASNKQLFHSWSFT